MQKSLSEKFVEKAILKHLAKQGWDYNVKTNFSVDDNGRVTEYSPKDFKNHQKNIKKL